LTEVHDWLTFWATLLKVVQPCHSGSALVSITSTRFLAESGEAIAAVRYKGQTRSRQGRKVTQCY